MGSPPRGFEPTRICPLRDPYAKSFATFSIAPEPCWLDCAAPSCDAIAESSAFGSGDYFSSANPAVPLSCNFF